MYIGFLVQYAEYIRGISVRKIDHLFYTLKASTINGNIDRLY